MQKKKFVELCVDLNREGVYNRFLSNYTNYFSYSGENFAKKVTDKLLQRIMEWCNSIEFNYVLKLPPDFHITHALFNMHVWMLIHQLKTFKTEEANYLVKRMELHFDQITNVKVTKIHIKKKNDFIKDLLAFMRMNRSSFERHFAHNPKTANNPYFRIDALIWSTLLFEKTDRYSDEVYILSEYLLKHYDYIRTLTFEDIIDGRIAWDVYRIPLDFKRKILEINPPLSDEEFQSELMSDNPQKKFFYNYDMTEDADKMPIDLEIDNKINYRVENMKRKVVEVALKYQTLDTFDFYGEREEKQKEQDKKEKKYVWAKNKSKDDFYLMNPDRLLKLRLMVRTNANAEIDKDNQ